MKKIFLCVFSLLLIGVVVSCKKDDNEEEINVPFSLIGWKWKMVTYYDDRCNCAVDGNLKNLVPADPDVLIFSIDGTGRASNSTGTIARFKYTYRKSDSKDPADSSNMLLTFKNYTSNNGTVQPDSVWILNSRGPDCCFEMYNKGVDTNGGDFLVSKGYQSTHIKN